MAIFLKAAKGDLELSAQVIHAPIHRITGAKVVMHTHQHWALALNMLEDNKLISANQTSAIYFDNQVAYDDDYTGAATTLSEGERLCSALGDKHTLFMKNHGVLVVGSTVAEAYHRLYLLERVCRVQVLAMATERRSFRSQRKRLTRANIRLEMTLIRQLFVQSCFLTQ